MGLNLLYQSDDNYAPQTGISILSLCENNKEMENIHFYLLNDGIREENLKRIQMVVEEYGRILTIISGEEIKQQLINLGVIPHRGSYTTYLKLLAISTIKTDNDLMLQIDGDTIINNSLAGLFDINISDYICAATMDCIQNSYKELLGIPSSDRYYNCGVLWINQKKWRELRCENQILSHLKDSRCKYLIVDQDIINVLFRDQITYLDITYNLNSIFYEFDLDEMFYIYDLDERFFTKRSDIEAALQQPIVNHCMGPMTGRPWEQDNHHPQNSLYDYYKALSPWRDIPKIKVKRSLMHRTEFFLHRVLPKSIYKTLHKTILKKYLASVNAGLKR